MVPSGAAGRAGTVAATHCGGLCGLAALRQAEKAWAAEKAALRREAAGEHKRANALDRELSAVRPCLCVERTSDGGTETYTYMARWSTECYSFWKASDFVRRRDGRVVRHFSDATPHAGYVVETRRARSCGRMRWRASS
jgi:hypothetical protein